MIETISFDMDSKDGDTETVKLTAKWAICQTCSGSGKTSRHVECDGGGFTSEEWNEQDEDFRRDYMSGAYDRPCETCDGLGRVLVIDRKACDKKTLKAYDEWQREEREYQAICAAERRMGA
jgi:hypothetical protein